MTRHPAFCLIVIGTWQLAVSAYAGDSSSTQGTLAADAARVISVRCLSCHSGDEPQGKLDLSRRAAALRGGEQGPALQPGDARSSLLWTRIQLDEMPPEGSKPLNAEERRVLKQWIEAQAPYEQETLDPFTYSTDSRGGYDWWSLQPVHRSAVPLVPDNTWARNAIDAFVWHKLQEHGLSPSPTAEPRTLVRRLFFDLIGLPPSPEQVDAFVAHPTDQAYEALVDQLLQSPRYGERWARHWLDVARFGESDGFERNNIRENQWHYRDWLIQAWNSDMPYQQFAKLQIAGDLLQPDGKEGLAAVAFLTAGIHNTVVGGSEFMQKTARQDELEEIAGAVGQTFVGLTINCARCHDHKFDPITQREYYRFISALNGVFHGDREYKDAARSAEANVLLSHIAELNERIAAIDAPVRAQILAQRKQGQSPPPAAPDPTWTWNFDASFDDTSGALEGIPIGQPRIEGGGLVVDDGSSYVETSLLPIDVRAKTLEVLVQLSNLDQQGGGVISLQTPDGTQFDAIVYGERAARQWMAGSDGFQRSSQFSGREEIDAATAPVHIVIVYREDGTIERYRNGTPYGESYTAQPVKFRAGASVLRFGIRHTPAGGNRHLRGKILQARFYDRALTPAEVSAAARSSTDHVTETELLAVLDDATRSQRTTWTQQRDEARAQWKNIDQSAVGKVYTVMARQQPGVIKILARGSVTNEGDIVTPGAIRSVSQLESDFGLAADATDTKRRLKLAAWITDPDNPLLARVIVNRLWHYHFGTGIVETPSDLGFNGGRPSHPELLDWLASELPARGWSLKELHRLIVTSSTYRQASHPNPHAQAVDAQNRLLWRKSPIRLDAESLRDSMLYVSGLLNDEQYGPGFRDVQAEYLDGTTYYTPVDSGAAELQRRTVYRFTPRGGRSTILDTFDCPDPAAAAPRRTVTTTPLQALAMLNDDFTLRLSDALGNRLLRESNGQTEACVTQAFRLAFQRRPDSEELGIATRILLEYGASALARVLFNCNEFITVE